MTTDILSLRDVASIEKAREAFNSAVAKSETLQHRVTEADGEFTKAQAARAKLVQETASGGTITAAKSREAEQKLREAEAHLLHLRDAHGLAVQAQAQASEGLAKVERESWRPLVLAGVKKRLAAAEKLDRLRHEMGEAQREFAEGVELVMEANQRGADLGLNLRGAELAQIPELLRPQHPSLGQERRTWAHHLNELEA